MSRYVKEVVVKVDHGGDSTVAVLRPLEFADLVLLRGRTAEGNEAMLLEFLQMLPRYLVRLEGAVDSEGNAVTVDDLKSAYWAGMVSKWLMQLVSAAEVQDPKLPDAPSTASLEAASHLNPA